MSYDDKFRMYAVTEFAGSSPAILISCGLTCVSTGLKSFCGETREIIAEGLESRSQTRFYLALPILCNVSVFHSVSAFLVEFCSAFVKKKRPANGPGESQIYGVHICHSTAPLYFVLPVRRACGDERIAVWNICSINICTDRGALHFVLVLTCESSVVVDPTSQCMFQSKGESKSVGSVYCEFPFS